MQRSKPRELNDHDLPPSHDRGAVRPGEELARRAVCRRRAGSGGCARIIKVPHGQTGPRGHIRCSSGLRRSTRVCSPALEPLRAQRRHWMVRSECAGVLTAERWVSDLPASDVESTTHSGRTNSRAPGRSFTMEILQLRWWRELAVIWIALWINRSTSGRGIGDAIFRHLPPIPTRFGLIEKGCVPFLA